VLIAQRPHPVEEVPSTSSAHGSSSSLWSPASATPSATRCAVPSCPRSPVRRSPASRSTPRCMSSRPSKGVKEDVTEIILNLKAWWSPPSTTSQSPCTCASLAAGDVTAADIEAAGRCGDAQPRPAHRDCQRQGQAWRWSSSSSVAAATFLRHRTRARQRDRPDAGRLDLQPRAEGHLQGRGHSCRAAHGLRRWSSTSRPSPRSVPVTRSPRPARRWSSCSVLPVSSTSRLKASTSARRRSTSSLAADLATAG
jgi:hypothetical protein